MKKIISVIFIIALITVVLLCFTGCAELINTETKEVDAAITDVYYKGAWVQPISTGKSMIMITHPAQYKVTFEYEDVTLTVDNKKLYDFCKDNIGATAKCNLIIEYYDDGTVHKTLELKEEPIK
jgi:hypothetical protein